MGVLPANMSVYHMCAWRLWRPEEGTGSGVTDCCYSPPGCWESNLGSLEEQPELFIRWAIYAASQHDLFSKQHMKTANMATVPFSPTHDFKVFSTPSFVSAQLLWIPSTSISCLQSSLCLLSLPFCRELRDILCLFRLHGLPLAPRLALLPWWPRKPCLILGKKRIIFFLLPRVPNYLFNRCRYGI